MPLRLCTEHFTCCIFGTTTAVTTNFVVVVVVVVVVLLTLTHRYNAVRGHRTCSDNLYSSSVQYARNITRLFFDETHARGAQIRYICYPYVILAFWRGQCLFHRPLGVWLLWYSDGEYIKNQSCTVQAHTSCWAVGLMPTTTCTSKTSRSTKTSVPHFVNPLGGVPIFFIHPKIYA